VLLIYRRADLRLPNRAVIMLLRLADLALIIKSIRSTPVSLIYLVGSLRTRASASNNDISDLRSIDSAVTEYTNTTAIWTSLFKIVLINILKRLSYIRRRIYSRAGTDRVDKVAILRALTIYRLVLYILLIKTIYYPTK
jgi:hypothetical protein